MYSFTPSAELLIYQIFGFPHWNSIKKELPVAPDTYRKAISGEEISQRSKNKLFDCYFDEMSLTSDVLYGYFEKSGYLPQMQLKGFIKGLRLSSPERRESFFLDQLEKVLDMDIQIGHLCKEEKNQTIRHEIFWQSDLAKKLCRPLGLRVAPSQEAHEWTRSYGASSLVLYFIAAYEVGLRRKYCIGFHKEESLVNTFLPKTIDSSIDWPIKNVTRFWQKSFKISSVEKLADLIFTNENVDIEHKKRRLDFWRSGEKNPDIDQESTLCWLKRICKDSSKVDEEFVRFCLATILQRFAKQMYPELFPPKVNSDIVEFEGVSKKQKMQHVEKLFQIYKHHYKSNLIDFQKSN